MTRMASQQDTFRFEPFRFSTHSLNMENDSLTEKIIGVCIDVHNELGTGFIEKVYENALRIALEQAGLKVDHQAPAKAGSCERVHERILSIRIAWRSFRSAGFGLLDRIFQHEDWRSLSNELFESVHMPVPHAYWDISRP